ncbi:AI-2E family transporter [Vallicoccus soli]|nr:AI-2E family transporter [Vallicoccus soli]
MPSLPSRHRLRDLLPGSSAGAVDLRDRDEPDPRLVQAAARAAQPYVDRSVQHAWDVHETSWDRLDPDRAVPWPVRASAAWAWRGLVLAAAVWVAIQVVSRLTLVVYSLVVALLLVALIGPAVPRLQRLGMGRTPAAALVFLGGVLAVLGILSAMTASLIAEGPDIVTNASSGITRIQDWLRTGPLGLEDRQIQGYLDQAQDWIVDNQGTLTQDAFGIFGTAGNILTGLVLALFTAFFFLKDGERIWRWFVQLFPRRGREAADEAGRRSWTALVGYVRGLVLIAAIDATGIGLVLVFVGVPLALPLAVLVFFGAFVPIVGAVVTGALAALVALVTNGVTAAVIVLIGILVVQQLEGNVLQPMIMSRSVSVHPLAVVLAVTAGGLLAGIGGAVVAVPLVAVLNTALLSLFGRARKLPEEVRDAPEGAPSPHPEDDARAERQIEEGPRAEGAARGGGGQTTP